MVAKVIGNRAASYIRGAGANGAGFNNGFNGPLGWVMVSGIDGDLAFLSAASCTLHVDQGYFFQTTGGAILSFTLQDAAMATNPDPLIQDQVLWSNPLTLTPELGIVQHVLGFAAIKVEFTAPGEVYLCSR